MLRSGGLYNPYHLLPEPEKSIDENQHDIAVKSPAGIMLEIHRLIHHVDIPLPTYICLGTPRKTNMEPEHHPFEKEKHLPNLHFKVPC